MSLFTRLAARALLCAATAVPAAATTFFVNSHAAPGGDGSSWSTAFKSLDAALIAAQSNPGADEIWIAEGRYRPTIPTDAGDLRSVTFKIPHNTTLRGGFLGTETTLPALGSARSTLLSGDVGLVGVGADNAYHVLSLISVNGTLSATLDGLSISDGYANGLDARGGGLFVNGGVFGLNLTMSNCIVRANMASAGGGMFYQSAHVRMWRCRFEDNAATKGGALRGQAAYLRCDSSRFHSNSATDAGGVISLTGNPSPDSVFMNCLFTDNVCTAGSGGVASMTSGQYSAGAGKWVNCTFAGNMCAIEGSVIYAGPPMGIPATAVLYNCVAWNNFPATTLVNAADVRYSDIEGGWPGVGNINFDPLFTATYTLGAGSKAIDAGSNGLVLTDVLDLDKDGNTSELEPFDLAGNARLVDDPSTIDTGAGTPPIVDMGAFEMP
jgi:hypothetical protein